MLQNLTRRQITQVLTKARTDLATLDSLVNGFRLLPEKYHEAAFDVFHSHLRKPIDYQLLCDVEARELVILSMAGIAFLGPYFSQHGSHLLQIWPETIVWAKALFRFRLTQECFRHSFIYAIGRIFHTATLCSVELLRDDDIFDFAVEMWKGDESEEDHSFVTRPILSCLQADKERINQFFERLDSNASFAVETMLERYSAAVKPTPRVDDIFTIMDISEMMCRFMERGSPKSVHDYLRHSFDDIPLILKGIRTVLQDTQQTEDHKYAVYYSFSFVATLAPLSANTMRSALDSGILDVSIDITSNPEMLTCGNQAESLINKLQQCLAFRPVTSAAVASMNSLVTRRDFNLPQMLRSTTTLFREEWTRFETLLLEQAVISSLFDNGFAVERGSCAFCKTIANRKDFLKCSGCDILLYCSTKCQESDWGRHRVDCKIVNEYLGKQLSAKISRAWRRQGILQANRYWSSIVVLARKKEIPLLDLGVQITYDSIPFKLDVFDCRKVDPSSVESIISKEVLRASSEGLPCFMLKTILPRMVDINMVYLNDPRGARGDGEACRTQGAIFVDEDNNRLYPTARDVVGDIISQSHALSKSDWCKLWGSKPFEILAKKAMEDGVVF